jgi:hypothetical protein
MSEFLPQFPLQIVVFPGEQVNLHIFEPRYQELIRDCEIESLNFGITAFVNGNVQTTGTEVRLTEIVKKYPGGESDIRVVGERVYTIQKFYPKATGKGYAGADVEWKKIDMRGNPAMRAQIAEQVQELFQLLGVKKDLPDDSDRFSVYDIAHHLGLNLQQEYELLNLFTEFERQQYALSHLTNTLPVVREMETLRTRVQMNGHFRNLKPPDF